MSFIAGSGPIAILYTRKGCSLCFELHRSASRASRRSGIPLRVVDITEDPALSSRYGLTVPVLELPGVPAMHGRVASRKIEEMFQRAAASRTADGVSGTVPPRRVAPFVAGLMRQVLSAIGLRGKGKA